MAWSPQQELAITTRGRDVLVSAGAGSGKTSVLTERVVRLVAEERIDITQLLIVTFTEAAAAEMRSRILLRLGQRLEAAQQSGRGEEARWLARQMSRVEHAQISTLHAFCMQVVRRHGVALGLDPGFAVPDEEDLAVVRATVCDTVLEQSLAGPDAEPLRTALTVFAQDSPAAWQRLVLRLDTFARSQPDPAGWLDEMAEHFSLAGSARLEDLPWYPGFIAWVERQLLQARAHAEAGLAIAVRHDGLERYARWLEEMMALVARARDALTKEDGLEQACTALMAIDALKQPKAARGAEATEEVKACRDAAREAVQRVLAIAGRGRTALAEDVVRLAPSVRALSGFVQAFQRAFQDEKRRRGWVDFHDLEHFALSILRDPSTGEAHRLRSMYDEICVDEYQDTSPIQEALLETMRRHPGNLFQVGDVKQSIYRFRMAEPRLFLDKYQGGVQRRGGVVIDLRQNFRSRPEVIHAVNHVFATLFCESLGGVRYDERARMEPGAQYPSVSAPWSEGQSLQGPVEIHLVERSSGGADTVEAEGAASPEEAEELDTIEKETTIIAQRIREWMGQAPGGERAVVWDAERGAYRPLRYRDIVILLRSVRNQVGPVLEVLRRFGIPAYGQTSTGFYAALEIRWLTAALAAIDNPRSDVDLVATLRSPMFGLGDADLARIRLCAGGCMLDALRAAAYGHEAQAADAAEPDVAVSETLRRRCREVISRLEAWRTLARRAGAEAVLERVLDDTGLAEYVRAMPGGALRSANLELLRERARAFDRSSTDGVFGFVRRLREQRWFGLDAGEARVLGENEDVVRVMTIHQSKGLEFPVVFVAGLGKGFYRDADEKTFPIHRDLGFGPQCLDADSFQRWPTVCSIAVEAADWAEFLAEEARILYVAMTRARERLILVGSAQKLRSMVADWTRRWSEEPLEWAARNGLTAKCPLHWLIPLWVRHPDGEPLRRLLQAQGHTLPAVDLRDEAQRARYRITLWNLPEGRPIPRPEEVSGEPSAEEGDTLLDVASPAADPPSESDAAAMTWFVPPPSGTVPAKVSATDLRRLWTARVHPGSTLRHPEAAARLLREPVWQHQVLRPVERGQAFHRVMARLDLQGVACTEAAIRAEMDRLCEEGWLSPEERLAVDPEAVLMLLASEPGHRVRRARRLWREQPFLIRVTVGDETVVVQGVIDLLAQDDAGWLIIDYKTDDIRPSDVSARAEEYAAQVATYREAVTRIFGTHDVETVLYFTSPRIWVPTQPVDIRQVFQTP
ncbi:MAG: helicase-exonuclease AddAB subunit AddA [Thermoflavifilum sp.]|nr:helicase-exonuclease AddAB subunit AddA [Thermoflavifilum sp.]MCL6512865.1 helicase-exonuclease AddAB subunit AddA [Alicyclobacillus sp.]